jgi:hypothetical protein
MNRPFLAAIVNYARNIQGMGSLWPIAANAKMATPDPGPTAMR